MAEMQSNKSIWRQLVLMALFIFGLLIVILEAIFTASSIIWKGNFVSQALGSGDWLIFLILPFKIIWSYIGYFFISVPFFVLTVMALIGGTYLGFKRRGTLLSFYPPVLLFISSSIFTVYMIFISFSIGHAPLEETIRFGVGIYLSLLISYLIVASFFHFKKTGLLLKIILVIFLICFVVSIVFGKVLAGKYSDVRKNLEEKIESLLQQAIKEKSPEKCEEMEYYFKEAEEKTFSYGEFIYENYYFRCITKLSTTLNDVSLCERLKKTEKGGYVIRNVVEDCITQVAVRNKNVEMCKGNVGCIIEVSNRVGDSRLCQLIENDFIREDCLDTVEATKQATGNKNIEACKNLVRRMECIKEVAFRLADPKICENIEWESIRQDCLDQFDYQ